MCRKQVMGKGVERGASTVDRLSRDQGDGKCVPQGDWGQYPQDQGVRTREGLNQPAHDLGFGQTDKRVSERAHKRLGGQTSERIIQGGMQPCTTSRHWLYQARVYRAEFWLVVESRQGVSSKRPAIRFIRIVGELPVHDENKTTIVKRDFISENRTDSFFSRGKGRSGDRMIEGATSRWAKMPDTSVRESGLMEVSLAEEFDILQIVGEGWFGKILLAEHRATDTEMVLKALPKPYVALRDFYREFHYGLHLGAHRNVITTYDVAFETAGFYVFSQEYAPLGDLTSNVSETGIGELHSKRVAKQDRSFRGNEANCPSFLDIPGCVKDRSFKGNETNYPSFLDIPGCVKDQSFRGNEAKLSLLSGYTWVCQGPVVQGERGKTVPPFWIYLGVSRTSRSGGMRQTIPTFWIYLGVSRTSRSGGMRQTVPPFWIYLENEGVAERGSGAKKMNEDLASALEHLHMRDLVHRDVKLDNILVFKSDFSRIKLCDFGETRREGTLVRRRNEWLPYSPPEVMLTNTDETYKYSTKVTVAEHAYKSNYNDLHRAVTSHDVWQFGIVIFVCLTGCLPWQKASSDDPRYTRYLYWHNSTGVLMPVRRPKLFKLLTSKAQRLFRKLLEPKTEKRPAGLADLNKFLDDRWLTRTSLDRNTAPGGEDDGLCPSMYSFHSSLEEKNKLLFTLTQYGIETTVDRSAKKDRIRDWIQSSVIDEEEEDEEGNEEDEEK
uniref:Protein kinase domain-containing protein n=1 Tax=Timema genevievae TaxID=629358 RepID=A0A7R9JRG8_TIMGE|nr:unnamed protein product [Timema genevievae]